MWNAKLTLGHVLHQVSKIHAPLKMLNIHIRFKISRLQFYILIFDVIILESSTRAINSKKYIAFLKRLAILLVT